MIKNKFSLLALVLFSFMNYASASSANFETNATLNSSCVISTTNIDFGSITSISSNVRGGATLQGNISATCSKGIDYSIYISSGSSNDVMNRTMVGTGGNSDTLKYNIYTDLAHSMIWTDSSTPGTGELGISGANGTGNIQQFPIYVKIPLNQFIKPDNYYDNLTVNVIY